MLLDEMSVAEINKAVYADFDTIRNSSTQSRLEHDYLQLRKKLNIPKNEVYPVFNTIKTKTKNHWLMLTAKCLDSPSIKSIEDVATGYYIYYHNHKGFRVFNSCNENSLLVYNGHLFTRYRERMNLTITDPIEIIKQFFLHNYAEPVFREFDNKDENGGIPFMTVEKDGYLVGSIQHYPNNITWTVHRTFIPHLNANNKYTEFKSQVQLMAAKEVLNYKLGIISELSEASKRLAVLYGLLDKEITNNFLEHLIEDIKSGHSTI